MIREIYEQPRAIAETLEESFSEARRIVGQLNAQNLRMVYFTGSGTSYHACLAVNYALSTLTRIFASSLPASEFPSWMRQARSTETILIAISQSGESADVMAAVNSALTSGMRVVALTNTPASSLASSTPFRIVSKAGDERAVTATKSFASILAAGYALVLELAQEAGAGVLRSHEELAAELKKSPGRVEETLGLCGDTAQALAFKFKEEEFFFLLGSGANYPTALEGALKLKESCNLYAEGFATREFLHGPMQLVDSRTPVFILQGRGEADQASRLAESCTRFGAPTVMVCPRLKGSSPEVKMALEVAGEIEEVFSPLVYVVPLQLYAYYSSVIRGLNPDRPEKLTKVVK